jgi:hypothetical protein
MALSAQLQAALEGYSPRVYWLLEITVGATTYKYASKTGYSSAASGYYDGRILRIGDVSSELSDWRGGLSSGSSLSVTLSDGDRQWQQLAEGVSARLIRGATATLYIAHPDVARVNWYSIPLEVVGLPSWPNPLEAELKLRRPDAPWRSDCPSSKYLISSRDWPDAPSGSIGRLSPLLYGEHNSLATSNAGMVPLIRVGAGTYILCAGAADSISTAYVDGVQSAAAAWSWSTTYKSGGLVTIVTYTSDPGESANITCDASGYATGGNLIEEPLDVLDHLITTWVDPAATLDATTFASSFFARSNSVASAYITERRSGYDLVNEFARSWDLALTWHYDGTVYAKPLDPCRTSIDQSDPWLRWDYHSIGPSVIESDDEIVTSVTLSYLYDAAQGRYTQALSVAELEVTTDDNATSMEMPWGAAQ